MKKFIATTALAGASFLAAVSVSAAVTSYVNAEEQTRDLSGFEGVNLKGSMDVYISKGSFSVRVVADDDIIDDIETFVDDDTLVIRREKDAKWRNLRIEKLDVYVTMPELDHLRLQDSGDIEAKDFKAGSFDLSLQGSGDIKLEDMTFDNIDIRLQGSGDIEIEGTCDSADVTVQGSGDIEAGGLDCKSADATVQGSGDLVISVSDSVKASVRGSGDITVIGEPKLVDRTVRGSGDIRVRGR